MKCEKCQQYEANIKMHYRINGKESMLHLCQQCYKNAANHMHPIGSFGGIPNFGGTPLEDFFKGLDHQHTPEKQSTSNGKKRFIDHYGRNLTQMAKAGLIDPVIGRDEEISRVIEILNRRTKNNPVLIGEPGVGKTAIAEGLALKISSGNVPKKLLQKEVYLLDVASLVSNTGIRGQFEERMKQLITELQTHKNIILFIDEIHLLVGAGSTEGSMDAGNILKPALARGELQLIGATTLNEYRQIEKDAALERRFQPVTVQEPSIENAITILDGLKDKYAKYHEVTYSDEAIKACVTLSHRYIQDRFLPDKAIDLMDEAGSKLNLETVYGTTESIEQRLKEIAHQKEQVLNEENYEEAAKLREEEIMLEKALNDSTAAERPIVTATHIQAIIEKKTGIPIGKLMEDEQKKLTNLQDRLTNKVIGQEEAVKKVAKAIRRSRVGLKAKNRPIGSFLFVGPTGVGKTELTKTLAEELFGSKDALIRLDMSEYMEKHSVSKIIGAPPGYVGHEEAGQLTEKVRRRPYSIILLDEIEKAHPDVQHMFLQIMEDGRLTDSHGKTVSFKDTVIIMTSNAGAGQKTIQVGFGAADLIKESNILDTLGGFFKPEFLNRFDSIIEFNQLEQRHLIEITNLLLKELKNSLAEQEIELQVHPDAIAKLADLGYHPAFGARPLRRVIQEQLEDKIADFIIEKGEISKLYVNVLDEEITVKETAESFEK